MNDHRIVSPSASVDPPLPAEEVVFFESEGETLLGFWTRSRTDTVGERCAAVFLAGGWVGTSSGRNRTLVTLARRLASDGIDVFRFEYHGVGDSTGTVSRFAMSVPFSSDARAAMDVVRRAGIRRLILVGICFGGRTALDVAADAKDVVGLALIAVPPVDPRRWTASPNARREEGKAKKARISSLALAACHPWMIREMVSGSRRRFYWRYVRAKARYVRDSVRLAGTGRANVAPDPVFIRQLDEVSRRGARTLLLFGSEDFAYARFQETADQIRAIQGYDAHCQEVVLQGDVHGLGRLPVQDGVIDAVGSWTQRISGAGMSR